MGRNTVLRESVTAAWLRLKMLFRRRQLEHDVEDELRFHLAMREAESASGGALAGDARTIARRRFGNVDAIDEQCRELWTFALLETFWHDIRYALRVQLRNPGFAVVAVLSLALGIGGTAAMFSLVKPILIQPLAFPQPERLFRVTDYYPRGAVAVLQERSRTMELAGYSRDSEFNLTGHGEALHLRGSIVSANLFAVLGAGAQLGRVFDAGEDLPGRDSIVILSHALWQSKFAADPGIVGRVITIDGTAREVVGVMPARFTFPSSTAQLWVPLRLDPRDWPAHWGAGFMSMIARLRPHATADEARAELRRLIPGIIPMFPFPMARNWNADATLIALQRDMVGGVRAKLLVLMAAVALVLLIACANVASLLLARAAARRKEMALRASLGAGRARILRQLLTESVVLALAGAALGLPLALAALAFAKSALPADTPRLAEAGIDAPALAFTIGLAVITGLVFGLAPAVSASRVNLAHTMKAGGQRSAGGGTVRLRSALIAGEVALAVVLVTGAGLLIRSLWRLLEVDPGFRAEQILTVPVTPSRPVCRDRESCNALYDNLIARARRITGVAEVAAANVVPVSREWPAIPAELEGHRLVPTENFAPLLWAGAVTPEYFRLLHIPILRGRAFTAADSAKAPPVIMVSAATARRYWPGEDPVGKHLRVVWDQQWRTVVGVAGDVRQYDLASEAPPGLDGEVYMPFPQSVGLTREQPANMTLLLSTGGPSPRIAQEIRALVAGVNPDVSVGQVRAMNAVIAASSAQPRSLMWLFVCFSGAALLLAAIGAYGVISYSVTQRTYEIGVRLALGATRTNLFTLVLGQSLRMVIAGLAAGIAASFALMRLLGSFLFRVSSSDPLTFGAVIALLLLTAIVAGYFPARRAARVDPRTALRVD